MSRSSDAARYMKKHFTSCDEAAKKFGISRQAVQQSWARLYGTELTPKKLADSLTVSMIQEALPSEPVLWGKLTSVINAIAAELGVHPEKVRDEYHSKWGGVQTLAEQRPRDVASAIDCIRQGDTIGAVSKRFGFKQSWFRLQLAAAGVMSHGKAGTRSGLAAAASQLMDAEGYTLHQAADKVGVAYNSVRSYRMRRGLPYLTDDVDKHNKGRINNS